MKYRKNQRVQWKWLGGMIQGRVVESHTRPLTKVIKGKAIKRNGSPENPAYLVRSAAGNLALKLGTELQPGFTGAIRELTRR